MKTIKITFKLLVFVLILSMFFNKLFSQNFPWETQKFLNFTCNTLITDDRTYYNDIVYDNYGLHFVGLSNNRVYYYLVDNNGYVIEQYQNEGINSTGVGITSHQGKVYIAAIVGNNINIYEKINGVSSTFAFKGSFSGTYYNFQSHRKIISIVGFGDYIYITWDFAGYSSGYPISGQIGFARYNRLNNTMNFYLPIDYHAGNPNINGGIAPHICSSTEKLHIVYTKKYEQKLFVTRNITLGIVYSDPIQVDNWGQTNYSQDIETRANIIFAGQKLYLAAHLFYYDGGLKIDTKFKEKNLNATFWPDPFTTIKVDDYNNYKYPPMIYDQELNKILFSFSFYSGEIGRAYGRYFNISSGSLENSFELMNIGNYQLLTGGSLANSIHGDFVVYCYNLSLGNYMARRQPRAISGNITYNTLLTGNEFIGSPCRTSGAKIIAMPGSNTQFLYPPTTNFYINSGDYFLLKPLSNITLTNSNIFIESGADMTLEMNSRVSSFLNSKIFVYAYGVFCNKGAIINGRLWVIYLGGVHTVQCITQTDIIYEDSTKVELTDGAIFEVPDNMTLYFRDPETVLQMDSNSTIKFGENSKLVFQNGARINAYKANFISSNPNSTWDGIYFEDNANDTIRFCTIENALSGVNIYDRNDVSGETPGTEISNCTFRNSTGNPLTSGIYALNSNNILISNNTFESPYADIGFSNGILLEYCPSGNINIIENDIDYSTYGITVIQSSPYIARNTITGRTNSNYGIYLDNSGGTIKYNTVNNFNSSLVANYSSPYVFRNSFANASERNVELRTYSVPIMKPIVSESNLYWLGGNNTITGTPSTSGIAFYEESYPETDEGYNIDDVNGADYMIGDVPTVLDRTLYATLNNWGDEIPDPNLFNVQDGTVDYEPTYDGITPIQFNDYELYDIGFGLYDTVYTKDLGDSPGGSTLFMQAYNKEMQHEYINAISLYKQVIINYRKSYFAVASVARILYCIEKAKGNIGQYLIHQNYLSQIRNNPNIPFVIKELAEDYIIKCKVKRGLLDEAISDYQSMYQQNQNNSKGFHALINKEIILSMKRDTSDNPVVTSTYDNIVHHKYNLFALLSGNNQNHLKTETITTTPKDYKLSQNYPNPFNPVTSIQYELPNDVFVIIKIYDVLGKEVAVLVNGFNKAGRYIVSFNGSRLSSGIYFYKIEAGSFSDVKRMVLIK